MIRFKHRPAALYLAAAVAAALPGLRGSASAGTNPDSSMTIKGGSGGKVFRKMTVEGEDRFRIEFERPDLRIDLDPAAAPGLDWDNTWDVLEEGDVDLYSPLADVSSGWLSPYLPRPWLDEYARGEIVRFEPSMTGVERWRLTIVDSRSGEVKSFEGKGDPPGRIGWDGLSSSGDPMPPGYTYSYVVEAWDRAGNNRNFVGKGFGLPPYRTESDDGMVFLFTGEALGTAAGRSGGEASFPPGVILEAASRINQRPVAGGQLTIEVTARTFEQADAMADAVSGSLGALLLGDPSRIRRVVDVEDNAPEAGTVSLVLEGAGKR